MLAGTFVRDRALNPLANPSRLQRLWLCEAVRLREEQAGLLDDSAIVRQLRHEALDLPQRIEQRALRLAARDGQASALQHAVQGARLALLLLAVLAVAAGFSMALAALGDGLRPVNLLWALGSLLGLHLLSLLLWLLVTACLAQGPAPSGQLWLWLSARLARDAQKAWARTPLETRLAHCLKALDALLAMRARIAEELTWQMGRPIRYTPFELNGVEHMAWIITALSYMPTVRLLVCSLITSPL